MAIVDITTKECVENISEDDTIFVTYQGHLVQIKKSDLHDISKLNINQGEDNAGKILSIDSDGNIKPSDFPFIPDEVLIDNTLTVEGQAADAKKVGDAFNIVNNELNDKANLSDIPKKLPNNFKLTFTGAVNEEYDGSSEKTINIPETMDISDTSISFSEHETSENIESGETISIVFGKIKKYIGLLRSGAFRSVKNSLDQTTAGSYVLDAYQGKVLDDKKLDVAKAANNLTTTATGYWLDASQGKILNDKINKKVDISKIVTSTAITETGFIMDGKTASSELNKLNSKLTNYSTYSTSEIQVGVMQDGSPVYRKIVKTPMTNFTKPTSGYQSVSVGLGVIIKDLLFFNVFAFSGSTFYPMPYSGDGHYGTWLQSFAKTGTQTSARLSNNVAWGASYTLVVLIEYTK